MPGAQGVAVGGWVEGGVGVGWTDAELRKLVGSKMN